MNCRRRLNMSKRLLNSVGVLVALLSFSCITFAQTYGTAGYSPGAWKPDELPKELSKPKPFNAHDLSGVWSTPTTAGYFERHSLDDKWIDIKDRKVPPQMRSNTSPPPMTEWGKAKFEANKVSYGPRAVEPEFNNDPVSQCEPLGYPRDLWEANLRPFEFIQTPDRVLQHMQYHDTWRTIWIDGRALPKDPDPAWYGYAIGRWEGVTFVVDSIGYDDRTWIDHFGNPHSDQMRLVERYRRVDKDTLELDMTLTDPKTYTKPWVANTITFVNPKSAIFEEICSPSEEHRFNDAIRDESKAKSKP
jgi:hypothetical protein